MKSPVLDALRDKTTQPQGEFHYYWNQEWRGSPLTFSPQYLQVLTDIIREQNENPTNIPRPFYIEWQPPGNHMIHKTLDWAEAYQLIHWCEGTNTHYDFRNEKDTLTANTQPEIGITRENWDAFYGHQTEMSPTTLITQE